MAWVANGIGGARLTSQWRSGPGKGAPGRSGGLKLVRSVFIHKSAIPQSWAKALWIRGERRAGSSAGCWKSWTMMPWLGLPYQLSGSPAAAPR